MILPLLLMVQAAPAADTVAIAQRLDTRWAGALRGGRCQTKRSTGDADIDRVGCAAMEACLPTYQSRYAGSGDRAIRPEVKKMMRSALDHDLAECVARERQSGTAALVARRKGA